MHFKNILALLSVTAVSQAFLIPAGTSDGEYLVRRNDDGTEEHVPVMRDLETNGQSANLESRNALQKRTICAYCGTGLKMNKANTDAAVQNVKDQTKGGTITIPPNQSYYAIRGGVVAFICNIDQNTPHSTNAGIFGAVLAGITQRCGQYVPGAALNTDDILVHGYQNWSPGTRFCDNWDKGTSKQCR